MSRTHQVTYIFGCTEPDCRMTRTVTTTLGRPYKIPMCCGGQMEFAGELPDPWLKVPEPDDVGEPDYPAQPYYCDFTVDARISTFDYDEIACALYMDTLIAAEFSGDLDHHWIDDAMDERWTACADCGSIVPVSPSGRLWSHVIDGRYLPINSGAVYR